MKPIINALLLSLLAVAAGCGGSGGDAVSPEPTTTLQNTAGSIGTSENVSPLVCNACNTFPDNACFRASTTCRLGSHPDLGHIHVYTGMGSTGGCMDFPCDLIQPDQPYSAVLYKNMQDFVTYQNGGTSPLVALNDNIHSIEWGPWTSAQWWQDANQGGSVFAVPASAINNAPGGINWNGFGISSIMCSVVSGH